IWHLTRPKGEMTRTVTSGLPGDARPDAEAGSDLIEQMFVRQAGGGYIQKRLQSAHLVKPHWLIPGTPPGAALRVIRCHLAIATTTLQVRYEEEPPSPRYGRFGKLLPGLKEATKTCSPRPLRSVSAT